MSIYSQTVSEVEAKPRYQFINDGRAFKGMTVSFTLTQHEPKMEYDENGVGIAKVETTSTSRHTVDLDINNAPVPFPKDASRFERNNPQMVAEIPAKSATSVVLTARTPVSVNNENPKSETTKTLKDTGPVKLNESNSRMIKGIASANWPGYLTQHWRNMFSSPTFKPKNKLEYRQDVITR